MLSMPVCDYGAAAEELAKFLSSAIKNAHRKDLDALTRDRNQELLAHKEHVRSLCIEALGEKRFRELMHDAA